MTTDERLDRLVERHEALTQSVQLLLKQSKQHDKEITENSRQIGQLATLVTQIAEGTARLVHAAEMHERRPDGHDDRIDRLEQ